jgi:hypothetical protein
MSSEHFILTKERLIDWLSDTDYMSKYETQVYKSMLKFYFDTFFRDIYPAERAIVEIKKDLGIDINTEKLLKLFYYDYWSRKKKKERAAEQDQKILEKSKDYTLAIAPLKKVVNDTNSDIISTPSLPVQPPSVPDHFEFKDAKDIGTSKKQLYIGKKQRQAQQGNTQQGDSANN